jgi:hypothetical protein
MSSLCEFDTVFIASMDLLLTLLLAINSGDSCHPMLPYLAQGANSAIEDGAVLGLLLGHLETKDQLPQALKMYERLRKSRGDAIARETFKQVSSHRVPCVLSGSMLTLCSRRESLSTCTTVQNSSLGTRCSHPNSVHHRSMSHSRVDGLARRSSHGFMGTMLLLWRIKQSKMSLLKACSNEA